MPTWSSGPYPGLTRRAWPHVAILAGLSVHLLDVASADDVQRELHSLFAHRSSAAVPDYASVRYVGAEIAGLCAAAVIHEAIRNEDEILARLMRLAEVLPASANRAFAMFKLLIGVAEQLRSPPERSSAVIRKRHRAPTVNGRR
jgi:hypothetical protein